MFNSKDQRTDILVLPVHTRHRLYGNTTVTIPLETVLVTSRVSFLKLLWY